MERIEQEIFYKAKPKTDCLLAYGFTENCGIYTYETEIASKDFVLCIRVNESVSICVLDFETKEEYIGYRVSSGTFAASLREEVRRILLDIRNSCFTSLPYHSHQALFINDYIQSVYGSSPEFLFEDSPDSGIYRFSGNGKWFALIMCIPRKKITGESDEKVEIINIKARNIDFLLTQPGIYPAWHMNKKTWISIILDGSISDMNLLTLLDDSYQMISKK